MSKDNRPGPQQRPAQAPVSPPTLVSALRAALVPLQTLYDLTGNPDLKPIIDNGKEALRTAGR